MHYLAKSLWGTELTDRPGIALQWIAHSTPSKQSIPASGQTGRGPGSARRQRPRHDHSRASRLRSGSQYPSTVLRLLVEYSMHSCIGTAFTRWRRGSAVTLHTECDSLSMPSMLSMERHSISNAQQLTASRRGRRSAGHPGRPGPCRRLISLSCSQALPQELESTTVAVLSPRSAVHRFLQLLDA